MISNRAGMTPLGELAPIALRPAVSDSLPICRIIVLRPERSAPPPIVPTARTMGRSARRNRLRRLRIHTIFLLSSAVSARSGAPVRTETYELSASSYGFPLLVLTSGRAFPGSLRRRSAASFRQAPEIRPIIRHALESFISALSRPFRVYYSIYDFRVYNSICQCFFIFLLYFS